MSVTELNNHLGLVRYLEPYSELLSREGVTEVMVNRPGETWIEQYGLMKKIDMPNITYQHSIQLVHLIASFSGQRTNDEEPLLSAVLPNGERIQTVQPPACEPGTVAFSIRKPTTLQFTMEDYESQGAFSNTFFTHKGIHEDDQTLIELKQKRDLKGFITHAILSKKNIILSGGTSSGKTTFLNTMANIIPSNERIITIEDVQETKLHHPNKVHLLYSKGNQGRANVSAADLLEVCLRMRPDRILPSELRGAEAFAFLEAINSGHPGSMTTMHANSAKEAINRMIFMCMRANSGMTKEQLTEYIHSVVDIIIQFKRVNGKRIVTDIYYEPENLALANATEEQ